MSNRSPELLKQLYRDMVLNRRVEERIESLYLDDNMKTPIHLYIGQEAISAGVCANLTHDDPILTTYRSHGQYLSKGGDLNAMIAELHCKETGCSHGRGGSMHLIDLSVGHYGSSAIVGGALPMATGLAFAKRQQGLDHVTVTFFGDGATDEGIFYESVNYAMLQKLPVVFVLENNGWAVCSAIDTRKAGDNLFHNADPDLLFTAKVDGNDVLAVYEIAQAAIERARRGEGPAFIECMTYRMRGHNGAGSDTHFGHRTDEELQEWAEKCPIDRFERKLIREQVLDESDCAAVADEIDVAIDAAFKFAEESPLPKAEDLMLHIYQE
jgi:pyruvate dehydrogenase E1 component alpha subunit